MCERRLTHRIGEARTAQSAIRPSMSRDTCGLVRGRERVRARSGGCGNVQECTATVKCLHGATYLLRISNMLVPGVLCWLRGPVLESKNQLLSRRFRGAAMHREALWTPN